ncbi:hypothetical protein E9Y_01085 [Moraxella catarrhalis 101P30B1]|nr:hypothetical protein E9Y_01085 [Moraxella catarrhalis 101P30B1]
MPSCNANLPFDSSVIKADLQNPWHQFWFYFGMAVYLFIQIKNRPIGFD